LDHEQLKVATWVTKLLSVLVTIRMSTNCSCLKDLMDTTEMCQLQPHTNANLKDALF